MRCVTVFCSPDSTARQALQPSSHTASLSSRPSWPAAYDIMRSTLQTSVPSTEPMCTRYESMQCFSLFRTGSIHGEDRHDCPAGSEYSHSSERFPGNHHQI